VRECLKARSQCGEKSVGYTCPGALFEISALRLNLAPCRGANCDFRRHDY